MGPMSERTELTVDTGGTTVAALLLRPRDARALYVLAHGAGAGMRHPFLEGIAAALAERQVATLRYQFPYAELGKRRPDPPHVAQGTVRAAVAAARDVAAGLTLVAGGKSFGGRMTSQAQAEDPLPGVRGLALLGFPLHAAGRPDRARARHLADVALPMLFLQGTRDALAELALVQRVCDDLGERATLHVVDGGDHSFKVPRAAGRSEADVLGELAHAVAAWTGDL